LIPERVNDPLRLVNDALRAGRVAAESRVVAASLEDVFVAVTMKPERQAA
jgi:hypothetical protein